MTDWLKEGQKMGQQDGMDVKGRKLCQRKYGQKCQQWNQEHASAPSLRGLTTRAAFGKVCTMPTGRRHGFSRDSWVSAKGKGRGVVTDDAEEGGACLPWKEHRWSLWTARPCGGRPGQR